MTNSTGNYKVGPGGIFTRLMAGLLLLGIISCSTTSSRYSMEHDKGPLEVFDASHVPDAVPVWEPLSRQGNQSPYEVRGVTYHLADTRKGYLEEGIASWYGLKFHGELTSNGEIYNMYDMTAAHKHLPLPSYVKVTNLENGKQVVVRVNDRGPFHSGRVIDLSYAAATKLGYANKGTAKVRVELIKPERSAQMAATSGETSNAASLIDGTDDKIAHFIQVAAFNSKLSAEEFGRSLSEITGVRDVFVASHEVGNVPVHRVRVGPFETEKRAQRSLKILQSKGYGGALIIQRALSASNI